MGNQYGDRYYPSFAGVGRSINYYPINDEKAEDGVVDLAVGLGKYIVDGGRSLRFSPRHPNKILQTSTLDLALRDTQTRFYALDMKRSEKNFSIDDGFNLLKLSVRDAEKDNSLRLMVSTYDPMDQIIRDGYYEGGRKVVTFANILKHNAFPLATILDTMLTVGSREMGRPVEIEFAGLLGTNGNPGTVYWLQIRPIVDMKEMLNDNVMDVPDEKTILKSNTALGHGIMDNVRHIVYVKSQNFKASNNVNIAREIEKINRTFTEREEYYILIGPGRWGSSDSSLGIPVKWPHISSARLIVESALDNYRIEPSQGTHFFQNLTSFGVGYFTVNSFAGDGYYDEAYLDSLPAVYESASLRIVEFEKPVLIEINGRKGKGLVTKPGLDLNENKKEE